MSRRTRKPAYQNKEKFRHNPNSVLTRKIYDIQHNCLCYRCDAQIEWRKDYRKYKLMKEPRRCNNCQEKCVNRSYHTFCDPCAREKGICAKCGKPCDESTRPKKVSDEEMDHRLNHSDIKERLKRTIIRNWERGLLVNEDIMVIITLAEKGLPIDWRDYKQDDEELDLSELDGEDTRPLARAKEVTTSKRIIVPELPPDVDTSTVPDTRTSTKNSTALNMHGIDNDGDENESSSSAARKKITILPKQTLTKRAQPSTHQPIPPPPSTTIGTNGKTVSLKRVVNVKKINSKAAADSSKPSSVITATPKVYRENEIQDELGGATVVSSSSSSSSA